MSYLMVLSITTAIICFGWAAIAPHIGLIIWAGFAGCTSFFAAGGKVDGFKKTIICNMSGVILASISIFLMGIFKGNMVAAIITGISTFIMCIQGKIKLLSFIPGTFIGSFSMFAANGNNVPVIISLLIGAVIGYCCEKSAIIFCNKKNIKIN